MSTIAARQSECRSIAKTYPESDMGRRIWRARQVQKRALGERGRIVLAAEEHHRCISLIQERRKIAVVIIGYG
jgi:hypothetical protein